MVENDDSDDDDDGSIQLVGGDINSREMGSILVQC